MATKNPNRQWLSFKIGNYFRQIRLRNGGIQSDIGLITKNSPQYICNYEAGNAGADFDVMRAYIKEYKLSKYEVLGELLEFYKVFLLAELSGTSIKDKKQISTSKKYDGPQIHSLRERLGLDVQTFAALLRAEPKTILRWESGAESPTSTECRLLEIYDKTPGLSL